MNCSRFARIAIAAGLLAPQALLSQTLTANRSIIIPPQQAASPPASGDQAARASLVDEEARADTFMARKQYSEAASVYLSLVQQEPRNPVLLNKLGIAYHQQTKLAQAKKYYELAAKADRTYASAYNNIGTIYYQRKNYRRAVKEYKKALEARSDMAPVYSNLGYAYFGQKRYDEAMDAFRRALKLDPAVFERSHSTGTLLQDRSVADKGTFYFYLAKSYASMGNAVGCALYLHKARDEGYKDFANARLDPAFAGVLGDPAVREVLSPPPPPNEPARPNPPSF